MELCGSIMWVSRLRIRNLLWLVRQDLLQSESWPPVDIRHLDNTATHYTALGPRGRDGERQCEGEREKGGGGIRHSSIIILLNHKNVQKCGMEFKCCAIDTYGIPWHRGIIPSISPIKFPYSGADASFEDQLWTHPLVYLGEYVPPSHSIKNLVLSGLIAPIRVGLNKLRHYA